MIEEAVMVKGETEFQLSRTYTLGLDVVSQYDATTTDRLTFLYDAHGSTRALVDSGALVVRTFNYDAYGNAINFDASAALTSLLYSGEQFNINTGLSYLRARYYDPANGRFTRMDPWAGNINSPLTLHKYGYGNGNPIGGVDPSGLFTLKELLIATSITVGITLATSYTTLQFVRNTSFFLSQINQFVPVDRTRLGGMYHGVTIRGSTLSADQLFAQMARLSQRDLFPVRASGNVTGIGGEITFDMLNLGQSGGSTLGLTIGLAFEVGQGDFGVRVTKYDASSRFFAARTLSGHPLAGWRAWGVRVQPNGDMVIETFSVEHSATWVDQGKMAIGGMSAMSLTWTNMLNDLARLSNGQIVQGPATQLDGRVLTPAEVQQYLQRVE